MSPGLPPDGERSLGVEGPCPAGPLALARRGRGIHLPRSPWVFDGLVEYVLQQRVTFRDAARAHRRLVEALGAAAPGPPGLLLPLASSDWRRLDARMLELLEPFRGNRFRLLRLLLAAGRLHLSRSAR